ncbi:MAG: pilus assembly protein N-terminal domain-containing protein [Sphingomonas sp.]|jgi:pilus assembly protein CpaC|uniref:type II and III secretion system protein family protein n=1 Tax=Sphingomonas sp. TaxID=28214 RepID=UPI0035622E28
MRIKRFLHRSLTATVATALVVGLPGAGLAAPRARVALARPASHVGLPPAGTQRPSGEVLLSIGQGELINLPGNVSDVWVSNPGVADVYVRNTHQINLFGKEFGEATIFATNASGAVIYSTNVRVSQNLTSIDRMMKLAMPDADIRVTTVGQIAVLTGTVQSPEDSAQAAHLVTALLNPGVNVSDPAAQLKIGIVNRLRTATPLQVNLQVRFAEVSRSFVKNIGVNLTNRDNSGNNFLFGISQGRQGTITTVPGTPGSTTVDANGAVPGNTLFKFPPATGMGTTLGIAGHFLGMDLLSSLDLGERDGQVSTLANPNLTAISGETGTFLAGGEIPIPVSQGLGAVSVEYKQYGVSLAYTPTVLADGRISLRVRPEVSQLSSQGAVTINGTTIPALTTRRAETTVELGSGQSFMIAGLLSNTHNDSIDKAPGVGDLPILGALFRSNAFQRDETELVIVITPYLVKPVNANDIVLPTDGYKAPTDLSRVLMGQLGGGTTGGDRPKPSVATPNGGQPAFGANAPVLPATPPVQSAPPAPTQPPRREEPAAMIAPSPQPNVKKGAATAAPGFNL